VFLTLHSHLCFCPLSVKTVKTTDVLYFRRALGFVDNAFPFSPAFGRANTREECVQSSQKIFEKLQTGRRHVLNFKSLCEITKSDDGTSDKMKIRDLISEFGHQVGTATTQV
jgi:hypothetical protein